MSKFNYLFGCLKFSSRFTINPYTLNFLSFFGPFRFPFYVELEISWGLGDCLRLLFGLNDEDLLKEIGFLNYIRCVYFRSG